MCLETLQKHHAQGFLFTHTMTLTKYMSRTDNTEVWNKIYFVTVSPTLSRARNGFQVAIAINQLYNQTQKTDR